ncbi:GNAT family N-acetyltransferase [Actinoplanes siamensis]|uniref:N-acetyltransferase n=1 Tax=Actinoplanes siamensis TaxID=1223317 RepID=A0A919N2Y3_9ACTN|nr:GNAT family N-acetyltransferase [Actinoplanes siamensis]GIF02533.1 N-acetyltransferase [Actinoplanes siamensis]
MTTHLRPAGPGDAPAVAALHADSWRRHYRGAYTDTFLDGDVHHDRLTVWTRRLATPGPDRTFLTVEPGRLTGFVHITPDEDPHWGALIDNLHVAHDRQRTGLGRALLTHAATVATPGRPVHLWVLEQNHRAQRFYTALGGRITDRAPVTGAPPGVLDGTPVKLRVTWPDAVTLRAAGAPDQ